MEQANLVPKFHISKTAQNKSLGRGQPRSNLIKIAARQNDKRYNRAFSRFSDLGIILKPKPDGKFEIVR